MHLRKWATLCQRACECVFRVWTFKNQKNSRYNLMMAWAESLFSYISSYFWRVLIHIWQRNGFLVTKNICEEKMVCRSEFTPPPPHPYISKHSCTPIQHARYMRDKWKLRLRDIGMYLHAANALHNTYTRRCQRLSAFHIWFNARHALYRQHVGFGTKYFNHVSCQICRSVKGRNYLRVFASRIERIILPG